MGCSKSERPRERTMIPSRVANEQLLLASFPSRLLPELRNSSLSSCSLPLPRLPSLATNCPNWPSLVFLATDLGAAAEPKEREALDKDGEYPEAKHKTEPPKRRSLPDGLLVVVLQQQHVLRRRGAPEAGSQEEAPRPSGEAEMTESVLVVLANREWSRTLTSNTASGRWRGERCGWEEGSEGGAGQARPVES